MADLLEEIGAEAGRRRNFAIISHPDAGKTTLTEKLLLYGGAIHEAGAVKARRARRHAVSDWMELERQRGISVTSTVIQFEYAGRRLNLLDTPGHQDFGEDTYRTLAAADNAVMLVDHARGLEAQTRKLFAVCRAGSLPTFTFVNKLDRAGRAPLELLDEIETELGLTPCAVNWPVGAGRSFRGVLDRRSRRVHLFERQSHGRREAAETVLALGDVRLEAALGAEPFRRLMEDLEVLDRLGPGLDLEEVGRGRMTPVFFGSAVTNFGVRLFLDSFLEYAAGPRSFPSSRGVVPPAHPEFTGIVFKLQANMDPRHRDCLAFLRVSSGKFTRDMRVRNARTGRTVRLSRPQKVFARDRESVDVAYPGDVVGLNNPGVFAIGDTVHTGPELTYPGIPRFPPEVFARMSSPDPSLTKKFRRGVDQLEEEGVVQVLRDGGGGQEVILAAVGELQLEVARFRLGSEYGVETRLDAMPHRLARWVAEGEETLKARRDVADALALSVRDRRGRPVLVFRTEWHVGKLEREFPGLRLLQTAPPAAG